MQRLSSEETELLIRFVTGGGTLVLTGDTGTLDCEGRPHEHDPFGEWRTAPACGNIGSCHHGGTGHVFYVPTGPWIPERVPIRTLGDVEMPVYPRLQDDTFGQSVLAEVDRLSGGSALQTDAPWFVRVRAWQQEKARALVVHWINYLQDEEAAIETPIPVGPIEASCRVEKGNQLERVDWLYPEMREPLPLDFAVEDGSVRFSIPRLIVHGMSVIRFRRP